MVQRANEVFQPVPTYRMKVLDQSDGGGVRATMTVINLDESLSRYSCVGPSKGVAKRMCAKVALATVSWSHNYIALCTNLRQAFIFFLFSLEATRSNP
jgi:hypothetical protein